MSTHLLLVSHMGSLLIPDFNNSNKQDANFAQKPFSVSKLPKLSRVLDLKFEPK